MVAAGAYLRSLREQAELSRFAVAVAAKTNESQIVRIEAGEIDTRGSLLLRVARAVRADLDTLAALILDDTADEDKAAVEAQIRALAATLPNDRRASLAEQLRRMADDLENQGL